MQLISLQMNDVFQQALYLGMGYKLVSPGMYEQSYTLLTKKMMYLCIVISISLQLYLYIYAKCHLVVYRFVCTGEKNGRNREYSLLFETIETTVGWHE